MCDFIKYAKYLIISLILSSCIETIDLSDGAYNERYVTINGQITDHNEPYVVTIAKSGTSDPM